MIFYVGLGAGLLIGYLVAYFTHRPHRDARGRFK